MDETDIMFHEGESTMDEVLHMTDADEIMETFNANPELYDTFTDEFCDDIQLAFSKLKLRPDGGNPINIHDVI